MATGHAEEVPGKVVFGDGFKPYWDEVFEGNPKIAKNPSKETRWVQNYPGSRPYVTSIRPNKTYEINQSYRAPYGKLYLSEQEIGWAAEQVKGDYIVVEPYIKEPVGGFLYLGRNKEWDKWGELLKLDYPWVQLGGNKAVTRHVPTKSFRRALAMLSRAKLLVTTDGALHHAAAALGVPAIVLWGGVVSPKVLGYPTHTNIWNGAESCGTFGHECPHCREAMKSISLDQVKRALEAA